MNTTCRMLLAVTLVAWMAGCTTTPVQDHPSPALETDPTPGVPATMQLTKNPPTSWILAPMPREVIYSGEWVSVRVGNAPSESQTYTLAQEALVRVSGQPLVTSAPGMPLSPPLALSIDAVAVPQSQGYLLDIKADGICITAHDEAGLFYGVMTLQQLARQAAGTGGLPGVHIADWPDFPRRGIMLDVTRDKVPEMETLYLLVDQMAEWKMNELQLYTEHTFAFRQHPQVWELASPMTPSQIRALDAYCQARYIDLVPNQNSFGHVERWLRHDAYKHLGEMPGGGGDLCPVDPDCIRFLEGLYNDLLPNFSSSRFNVGCDETWSLGKGRSAEAVKERGEGRVYLDFLLQIQDLVSAHGKEMQFWGDIIIGHPELIPELRPGMTAMEWGYEAGHPFAEHGAQFAAAGIPFYVVPGTSSWNSILGRTDNALANLRNAADNGLRNGAVGFLMTDWGDFGHWQFLPVSYGPFLYGACLSWAFEANTDINLPVALDVHVFKDTAGIMGQAALDLGNTYKKCGVEVHNNTVLHAILARYPEEPIGKTWVKDASAAGFQAALNHLDAVTARLDNHQMTCSDAALIEREFRNGVALARFACHTGIARLQAGDTGISGLPPAVSRELATELADMLPEYRQLWLARNRSGGLKDSTAPLETILATLNENATKGS